MNLNGNCKNLYWIMNSEYITLIMANQMFNKLKNLSRSRGIRNCHTCYYKERTWFQKILVHCGFHRRKLSSHAPFEGVGLSKCSHAEQFQNPTNSRFCFVQVMMDPFDYREYGERCSNQYKNWLPFNKKEQFEYKLKNDRNQIVSDK